MNEEKEEKYSEQEIREAWIEAGRKHNGLTIEWVIEELRKKKYEKN